MRRRKPRGRARQDWFTLVAIAFGFGLLLSWFCSARFALLVAAAALIYMGVTFRC